MKSIIRTVLQEQWEVAHKQAVLQKFIDRILTMQFDIKYENLNHKHEKVGETTYAYQMDGLKVEKFEGSTNRLSMMVYFPYKEAYDGTTVQVGYRSKMAIEQQLKRIAMRYNIILSVWIDTSNHLNYDEARTNEYVKLKDETEIGGLNYIYKA